MATIPIWQKGGEEEELANTMCLWIKSRKLQQEKTSLNSTQNVNLLHTNQLWFNRTMIDKQSMVYLSPQKPEYKQICTKVPANLWIKSLLVWHGSEDIGD